MKARRGQVAVYLVMALVAIAVLMFANVNVFLAVRAKNRMMNAVDESALAVAKRQGDLLNRLGRMNVAHLRSLILKEEDRSSEDEVLAMRELAMFGPLEALADAERTAADWGFPAGEPTEPFVCLRRHISEIADEYCANPDLYPEYRRNQWEDYAARLAAAISGNSAVAPGFLETANAWSQEPLLSQAFYDAIAARAWCWFGFGGRSRYFDCDSRTMARPEFRAAAVQENSEVFSLHVTFRNWQDSPWGGVFDEAWTNFVCQVTGCTRKQLKAAPQVTDPQELWAFYDDRWRPWSRTFNPDDFPIAGPVKPEYDVGGCVASCLMVGDIPEVIGSGDAASRSLLVTAEAKPLGTVDVQGRGVSPVTAFNSFIAPDRPGGRIFTEAALVLVGSVPRDPGVSLAPAWYVHVKDHLPAYLDCGRTDGGCYYCRQLREWENPAFRAAARSWLDAHRDSCTVKGGGGKKGGYDYAH